MVTIKQVAERAGVSTAVVSAALGGASRTVRMSEATRRRVEQAIAETGYRANHAAKSLSLSRTGVIAAVVPKIANPVFEYVIRGMHAAAEERGEVLLLADSMWIEPGTHLMARMAGTGMVDGFLVRTTEWGSERIEELTRRQLPYVVLQQPGPDDAVSVWIDDRAGIATATRHLLELGHRDIALVGGPPPVDGPGLRTMGFRDALTAAGLPFDPGRVHPIGYDPAAIAARVHELMTGSQRPTALVVDNIISAPGATAALADLGLRVPEDVSVVVYHDLPTADQMRPAPTTVRMPLEQAGRRGYQVLQELIAGQDAVGEVIGDPAPELVDRGSTAPPR
ncbi:MAG TPA: LacI family DNA-binding transcriptional regulator [Candidatus Avipropionibacterium avicola]|uniref:LacI family DNA-binding transcriptional regulator n=1 Tax=Candidatus Avipropionibacterium avicola TaxID=2840701 RepID=A0A9D1H297_9ACTN|nr:LacI family DNA-binding transcriptional regulator [Candidatus Avipropionibacterium avicola]